MTHFKQRLEERILNNTEINISVEGSNYNYQKVGTMKVTDLFKKMVTDKVNQIENTNFRQNKSFGVLVSQMGITSNLVKFDNEEIKKSIIGKTLVASVVTNNGESNGNQLYCIVRDNKISTFCLVKSYTSFNSLADKLRVDAIIKNVKKYKK